MGFTVVSVFLGGPLILKLTPNTPSPVFEPTKILPNIGIDPTTLLIVVAGTNVPLKLTSFFFLCIHPSKLILLGLMHILRLF